MQIKFEVWDFLQKLHEVIMEENGKIINYFKNKLSAINTLLIYRI